MRLKFCVVLVMAVFIINIMAGINVLAQNEVIEFEDVHEGFWAKSAIDNWKDRGVIKGDGKKFNPNIIFTRAEMVAILNNIFKFHLKKDNPFSDVKEGAWYYDAIVKGYAHGVIKGNFDEKGSLEARPNHPLTRAEAAVIFTNVFSIEVPSDYNSNFKDENLPKWAENSIFAMEAEGYIRGKEEGFFDPYSNLTRAEMVQILDNVIKLYLDAPGEYSADVAGNVVISSPGVKLKNMKIEGNLYLAEGIGDGDVEFENVYVSGITFVRGGSSDGIKAVNSVFGTVKIEKEGINLNLANEDTGDLEEEKEDIPAAPEDSEGQKDERGQNSKEQGAENQESENKGDKGTPGENKDEQGTSGENKDDQGSEGEEPDDGSHYPDSADIVDY